jgi:hypothetical protein
MITEHGGNMNQRKMFYLLLTNVLVTTQIFCGSALPVQETPTPSATHTSIPTRAPSTTPTQTLTPTTIPTATLGFPVPTPANGTSVVLGQILWDQEPVLSAKVLLCEEYGFGGCAGKEYSASTNAQGYYVFKNIKPGDYALVANIPSTNWYIYTRSQTDFLRAIKRTIGSNQTMWLDPFYIYKVDLRSVSPIGGVTINETRPTLKWKEYPNAAYYEITFWSYYAKLFENKRVNTDEYAFDESLPECMYQWTVEAFNQDGIKIAETADRSEFRVSNPDAMCKK